jgi:hypothetical protein
MVTSGKVNFHHLVAQTVLAWRNSQVMIWRDRSRTKGHFDSGKIRLAVKRWFPTLPEDSLKDA